MRDRAWANRILRGDKAAGERLVTENYKRVFSLLRSLTGHREAAEDLTQQTFTKAWQGMAAFRGEARLSTWIRSMAIAALTRILPRMRSSDSHLLSGENRRCLHSWLDLRSTGKHAEFQEALLKALEQVGDVNALENVSALAAKRPSNVRERRVVDSPIPWIPASSAPHAKPTSTPNSSCA